MWINPKHGHAHDSNRRYSGTYDYLRRREDGRMRQRRWPPARRSGSGIASWWVGCDCCQCVRHHRHHCHVRGNRTGSACWPQNRNADESWSRRSVSEATCWPPTGAYAVLPSWCPWLGPEIERPDRVVSGWLTRFRPWPPAVGGGDDGAADDDAAGDDGCTGVENVARPVWVVR